MRTWRGYGDIPQYCSNTENGSTKTRIDQINNVVKVQIKFQRRSMVMLRFLACVSRSHAFDDASLDAHGLFGQALQADFSDQRGNHVLPAWCVNQTQRDQTFIHDADSLGKTDLSG